MTTPTTDPKLTKLIAEYAKLERIVHILAAKIQAIEKENTRLKHAIGRTANGLYDAQTRMSRGGLR